MSQHVTAGYALATQWGSRPYRWTTAEGRHVSVRRMTKTHLRNALRMLFRVADLVEMRAWARMPDDALPYVEVPTPTQTLMNVMPGRALGLLVEWRRRGYKDDVWMFGDPKYGAQLVALTKHALRAA